MDFMEWLLTVDFNGELVPWVIAAMATVDKIFYIGMKTVKNIIDTYKELFGGTPHGKNT
jgi:hypothetical protein